MHAYTSIVIVLLICLNGIKRIVNGQEFDMQLDFETNQTNIYWPPVYDSNTIELEKMLMQQLDLGCTSINYQKQIFNSTLPSNDSNPEFFMISETENHDDRNNPIPMTFIHIPTGKSLSLQFECDDCPNNKIIYNEKYYDTSKFDCKTLCIFTAFKSDIDKCRKAQMFKIGLKIGNKFQNLLETCHLLELPSNLTYDAETIVWKLGKFSRTIQNEQTLCQRKCMPVCWEQDDYMESIEDNDDYVMKLMENLCDKHTKENISELFMNEIICSEPVNRSSILNVNYFLIYIIKILIIFELFIMLK